jgi:peptide/nickel transport system permease protein
VQRYIIRRLLLAIPVIWLVITLVFFTSHLRSGYGDRLAASCTRDPVSCAQTKKAYEHEYGTDKPLMVQYLIFMGHLLQGDLGKSFTTRTPVLTEILHRSPPSIEMGLMQIALATILAIPIGVISALKQDTFADYGLRVLSIGLLAIPVFFSGPLILLFCYKVLNWGPPLNLAFYKNFTEDPIRNLQIMVIPVIAGAFATSAAVMRLLRSQLLEVMRQDYVRTATAKGLRQSAVVIRHTLKNAMIPVLTILGLQVAGLVGGNILLERIFNIPGIGLLSVTSIQNNDLPMVAGVVLVVAVIIVLTNLLIDIAYGWFDPRIRYS